MNLDLETVPQPRVSVKVGYFLTDLPAAGMGNLCVVPGSHRHSRPAFPMGEQPSGAVEVTAAAGDAILFDRRRWHSASTNHSERARVFLTVGYSYRWLRPKSAMDLGALLDTMPPIRRQLLGAMNFGDPTPRGDGPPGTWHRREHIVRSCEQLLQRLRTEHVDLYELHRPSSEVPQAETLAALDELVRDGKVRWVGASSFPAWMVVEARAIAERDGLGVRQRAAAVQPVGPAHRERAGPDV